MPIEGPSKLIPTMTEFIAHWKLVERTGGALRTLTVLDGVGREGLVALREALGKEPGDVVAANGDVKSAREVLKERRNVLVVGIRRFNVMVRGDLSDKLWVRLLAYVPDLAASFSAMVAPARVTLCVWRIIERAQGRPFIVRWADVPELMSADFAARIAAFVAAYGALRDAETDLALARAEWDILEERAVAVMKAYGHMVKGNLGDGSRLAASLPQLWPGPRRGERRGKAGRSSKAAGQEADASG